MVRRALAWVLGLGLGLPPVAILGHAIERPEAAFWRARYWLEDGGKRNALGELLRADPDGAWLELSDALRSGDELLRYDAGWCLRKQGDPRGLRQLVDLCYEYPNGHIKLDPQIEIGEAIVGDPRLGDYAGADAWWSAMAPRLRYAGEGRWILR